MPRDKFLSTKEVAERLRIAPAKVRTLIREGLLPAANVGLSDRPQWRIKASDVDKLVFQWGTDTPPIQTRPDNTEISER